MLLSDNGISVGIVALRGSVILFQWIGTHVTGSNGGCGPGVVCGFLGVDRGVMCGKHSDRIGCVWGDGFLVSWLVRCRAGGMCIHNGIATWCALRGFGWWWVVGGWVSGPGGICWVHSLAKTCCCVCAQAFPSQLKLHTPLILSGIGLLVVPVSPVLHAAISAAFFCS